MATTNHLETLGDLLRATAYAGFVADGPVHDQDQDRVIGMVPTGDQAPPEFTFHSDKAERSKTVQLRVRGPANDFGTAYDDARLVEDALTDERPAGYLAVRLINGPLYIQADDQGRHEFSFNLLCWLIE